MFVLVRVMLLAVIVYNLNFVGSKVIYFVIRRMEPPSAQTCREHHLACHLCHVPLPGTAFLMFITPLAFITPFGSFFMGFKPRCLSILRVPVTSSYESMIFD